MQLHYLGPLKVNNMRHSNDATAGNKRVTALFEVAVPLKVSDRFFTPPRYTFNLFKVSFGHY